MTPPCSHTFVDRAREGALDCVICLRGEVKIYAVFQHDLLGGRPVSLHREASSAELKRYSLEQEDGALSAWPTLNRHYITEELTLLP